MSGVLEELLAQQKETQRLLTCLLDQVGRDEVSVKEAAVLAHLSPQTIRRMIKEGKIPWYGSPNKIRIKRNELTQALSHAR